MDGWYFLKRQVQVLISTVAFLSPLSVCFKCNGPMGSTKTLKCGHKSYISNGPTWRGGRVQRPQGILKEHFCTPSSFSYYRKGQDHLAVNAIFIIQHHLSFLLHFSHLLFQYSETINLKYIQAEQHNLRIYQRPQNILESY